MSTPAAKEETLEQIAEREQVEKWERAELEKWLELWRGSGTRRFELAVKEIDTLRALVDEQLAAMANTPSPDINYAGNNWRQRAAAIRRRTE